MKFLATILLLVASSNSAVLARLFENKATATAIQDAPIPVFSITKAANAADVVVDSYILHVDKTANLQDVMDKFQVAYPHATIQHAFRKAAFGFSVKGVSEMDIADFAAHGCDAVVTQVLENAKARMLVQPSHNSRQSQMQQVEWGLDRIDDRNGLDNTYEPSANGDGVYIYVIDTGVQSTHDEFTGRIQNGADFSGEGDFDGNGHGTHVAGSAAGRTYGVAKGAYIVPVKVLDSNGEGAYDNIVAGIDYVIQQHEANGGSSSGGTKSVANLSLGGGYSDFLNAAIRQAVDAGVVMVVAAGNEDQDACNVSPASESSAITVGSSDRDDRRSEFSNWGGCVDIFAPGSDITSAVGGGGDSDTATMSGTSMASPHVAGAAALVLSADARLSAADVAEILVDMATSDALSDTKESPNKLLYVGDIQQDDGGNGRQPSDPSPPSDPQMPPPDDGDEDAPQMPPPPGGRRPADDDDAVTDDEAVMDDDAAFNPPPPSDDDVNRDQPQMPPPSNDDETPLFDDDAFFVPTPAPNDDAMPVAPPTAPVAPPTAPVAPPPTAPTDDDEDTDGGDDDDDAFVPTPAPNDDTMPVAPPPTAPDAPPPTAPDAPPPTAPDAPPPTAPANDDDVTGGGDDDVVTDDDDALTPTPTLPPAVSPPTPPPTANATRVTFTVAFDTYREETTMDIWQRNDTDSHWLQLESCKPRVRPRRSVTLTLPNGYFSMDMHDSFGDGIDSGYDHDGKYKAGYFELVETDTGRVVHHGGKFKSYFSVEFETKDGVVIAEQILNW